MANKAKRIKTLDFDLDTKPGALAHVFSALHEANVNVNACWAYETGSEGKAHIYTEQFDKAKKVLKDCDVSPKEGWACYVEGSDKVGVYADCLSKIAKADVNLQATDAFGIGGKFASVFWADKKDFEDLCSALDC